MKQKRQPFQVLLLAEHKALFAELAADRGLSLSAWLVQAALSYARSAKRSSGKNAEQAYWPSGWKRGIKCHVCGKLHDPQAEHKLGAYDEYERALGEVRA